MVIPAAARMPVICWEAACPVGDVLGVRVGLPGLEQHRVRSTGSR